MREQIFMDDVIVHVYASHDTTWLDFTPAPCSHLSHQDGPLSGTNGKTEDAHGEGKEHAGEQKQSRIYSIKI